MFSATQSIIIPFDKKRVYEVAETYPYFIRFFLKDSRIVDHDSSHLRVEVHAKLFGFFPSRWEGVGIKKPYQSIHFTQTKGLFQGLTAIWSFEATEDGTRVSICTSFSKPKLGQLMEWVLGKFVVERTTKKILLELQYHVPKSIPRAVLSV